jgi:hypothetical protein
MSTKLIFAAVLTSGIIALSLFAGSAGATPVEEWNKAFGSTGYDSASYVRLATDGGYIISGRTCPHVPSQCGPWLIKTDARGNEEWNRSFWGGGFGSIKSVLQTRDGGYALGGLKGKYGALLIKVDEDGNEQWNWTFGEWNRTSANSVVQANDGSYFLVGTMDLQTGLLLVGTMDLAAMFVKIDENGSIQWFKTRKFKGKAAAVPNSVQRTSDRGYIISVEAHSYGGYNKDSWLIKTDENGNEQWNMTLGGEKDDEAFSVQQTGDGGYIAAGTTSFGAGKSYAWLRKISEEQTGTATPTANPTETPIATPVSNETQTVSPSEKIAGFEIILPIAIFLAVYKIGWKRR